MKLHANCQHWRDVLVALDLNQLKEQQIGLIYMRLPNYMGPVGLPYKVSLP